VYHLDGKVRQIAGTGRDPEFHSYEIHPNGDLEHTVRTGPTGGIQHVQVTVTNGLGMIVKQYSGLDPSQATEIDYDQIGRKVRVRRPGTAAELFVYDSFGNLKARGFDLNDTGHLEEGSGDLITIYEQFLENEDSQIWEVSRTHEIIDNSVLPPKVQTTTHKRALGGSPLHELSVTIHANGLTETTTSVLSRGTASRHVTHTNSRGETVHSLYRYGLLLGTSQLHTGKNTLYQYDHIDRLTTELSAGDVARQYRYDDFPPSGGSLVQTRSRIKEILVRPKSSSNFISEITYHYGVYGFGKGKVIKVVPRSGHETDYLYNSKGRVSSILGPGAYPVAYTYNNWGALASLTTYRSSSNSAPSLMGQSITRWLYDSAGRITHKFYNMSQLAARYHYDQSGRLYMIESPQVGGNFLTTTHTYDSGGRLESTFYSDGTPGEVFTYYDNDMIKTVTDGLGTTLFSQDTTPTQGTSTSLNHTGGALLPSFAISESYDTSGRRTQWNHSLAGQGLHGLETAYYPNSSRPLSFSIPHGHAWEYAYLSYTHLVHRINVKPDKHSTQMLATSTTTRTVYDQVDTITHSTPQVQQLVWKYDYHPNEPTKRTRRFDLTPERSGWDWEYNTRGELASASRGGISGQTWTYEYDDVGNRKAMTRTAAWITSPDGTRWTGPNGQVTNQIMTTTATYNALNQPTTIERPQSVEIAGIATPSASLRILTRSQDHEPALGSSGSNEPGQTADDNFTLAALSGQNKRPPHSGELGGWSHWLQDTLTKTFGQWPLIKVRASNDNVGVVGPIITETTGRVWIRPDETPVYDPRGNLIQDGGWTYE
jgi:YD repeat-containing protein